MNILIHLIFILFIIFLSFISARFLNWYLDLIVKAINENHSTERRTK